MRVAVYARYSSDRQQPRSIDDQIRICKTYAERQGWRVYDEHVYTDAGISGTLSKRRPGYQALLHAASERAFEAIIAEDQSRLWRNQEETHHALKRLRFHGIKVFSVSTGADLTDRAGRMLATVMGLKDDAPIACHKGLPVTIPAARRINDWLTSIAVRAPAAAKPPAYLALDSSVRLLPQIVKVRFIFEAHNRSQYSARPVR